MTPLNSPAIKRAVDSAIGAAKGLPDLISRFTTIDPALATLLTGKLLIQSRSPWGTLAVAIVAYVVARFSLGWDQDTVAIVAAVGVLAGSYLMRMVTSAPIVGIVTPPAASNSPPASTSGGIPAVAAVLALLLMGIGMSACTTKAATEISLASTTVTTDLTKAQAGVTKAVNFWKEVKGLALVAELAEPSLQPLVTQAINIGDPIADKVQVAAADAATDVPAIQALVAQLTNQGQSLMVSTAGAITVVPKGAVVTPAAKP